MSSDWPSALAVNQVYSPGRSPIEIESPQENDSAEVVHQEFVRSETVNLVSKVKALQTSYDEYLSAQQTVLNSLRKQYDTVSDDEGLRRVTAVLDQLETYSKKMDRILKRMDSIYDRVDKLQSQSEELITVVKTVPPGKPIPPASKQIQDSVNGYMSKAKSSIESTVQSAKSGEMKEKIADSMSNLGEKVNSMMGKAKSTVQNLRNYIVCYKQRKNHSMQE